MGAEVVSWVIDSLLRGFIKVIPKSNPSNASHPLAPSPLTPSTCDHNRNLVSFSASAAANGTRVIHLAAAAGPLVVVMRMLHCWPQHKIPYLLSPTVRALCAPT